MFEVSEKASEMLTEFFKNRVEKPNVRVFLNDCGCAGASLGMTLDEPVEGDEVYTNNGITFVIEKELFDEVKPIRVDYIDTPEGSGFSIKSSLPKGGCGGSCSAC